MGDTYFDSKGYPRFKNSGIPVHRAVAENKIDRPLKSHEVVHHKDGDKSNYRMTNLAVLRKKFHRRVVH